jgi:hypothetical protein
MTVSMITHQMRVVKGLYELSAYAKTHPACQGWVYAIRRILARLEVTC